MAPDLVCAGSLFLALAIQAHLHCNPPLTHPAQCVIDVDLNSLQFGLDAPFFKLLVDQRDRPTGPLPTLVAQVSGRTWTAGGDE